MALPCGWARLGVRLDLEILAKNELDLFAAGGSRDVRMSLVNAFRRVMNWGLVSAGDVLTVV